MQGFLRRLALRFGSARSSSFQVAASCTTDTIPDEMATRTSTNARKRTPARTVQPELAAPVSAAMGRRRLVFLLTAVMFAFGAIMVASATSGEYNGFDKTLRAKDQWEYLVKTLQFGVMGFVSMMVASRVPMLLLERLSRPFLMASAALLFLVFVPGLGQSAKGATRWIGVGSFTMQPSEVVKLALIVYLATHLSRVEPPKHWWRDFVRSPGGIGLLLCVVIFSQHDLGSSLIAGLIVISMFMLAGTHWKVLFSTIGPIMVLVAIGIAGEQYRRERFLAFLDPWADPFNNGYQLVQGLLAIGSGGPFGVGLGHSIEKIVYLPEAHTDMMFAIIAEELGIFGVGFVIASFVCLALVGFRIATMAERRFDGLLAAGITTALSGQAVLNLCGVTGLLPLTGVPLPLLSYGGSSLIITLTALGLLANVATADERKLRAKNRE